jgi:hypothetical protein
MSSPEFTTASGRRGGSAAPSSTAQVFDPLRYCLFTTIALLAWLLGPAVVVVAMSALGIVAYWRALRAGLTRSRCVLGDTRLVMLYLAFACIAGVAALAIRVISLLSSGSV